MSASFKYHANLLPFAPSLTVQVDPAKAAGVSTDIRQLYTVTGGQVLQLPTKALVPEWVTVFDANGAAWINKPIDYETQGWTYNRYNVKGFQLILAAPFFGDIEVLMHTQPWESKRHIIDMRPYMLQMNELGVSHGLPYVAAKNCTLHLMTQAQHGSVRIGSDRLSFDYTPRVGFIGADTFSYKLCTRDGQESEPKCITLLVGF